MGNHCYWKALEFRAINLGIAGFVLLCFEGIRTSINTQPAKNSWKGVCKDFCLIWEHSTFFCNFLNCWAVLMGERAYEMLLSKK